MQLEESLSVVKPFFTTFSQSVEHIPLPERFTFPFYYEPHKIAVVAVKELQAYLTTQTEWEHNFGFEGDDKATAIGKMFGVLVVEDADGNLGYLAAFSGKLANSNQYERFVPPIFDMLDEQGHFKTQERKLNTFSAQIKEAEKNPLIEDAQKRLASIEIEAEEAVQAAKVTLKAAQKVRKTARKALKLLNDTDKIKEEEQALEKARFKAQAQNEYTNAYWALRVESAKYVLEQEVWKVESLRIQRKALSAKVQQWLFDQYHFLNKDGKTRSVVSIFEQTVYEVPPAGAGECAAPKLLQYAFAHNFKPIALAEFWWGASPKSAIRKHKNYYPACRGKCQPILGHMLDGVPMDPNPMAVNPAEGKEIEIIYEDDFLLVVNKPAEFFSVPGRVISDSVATRMRKRYPDATGPMIVHRLDMSTSGLMLLAKTKKAHELLQRQFLRRIVKKRYVALLEGPVEGTEGFIDLPLRGDLFDRPRQLVCKEEGKASRTQWELIEHENNKAKVYYYPITGRTHQLRVHSAHPEGMNWPIIGDDLYGTKADRLYLHAERIGFKHPETKEWIELSVAPDF